VNAVSVARRANAANADCRASVVYRASVELRASQGFKDCLVATVRDRPGQEALPANVVNAESAVSRVSRKFFVASADCPARPGPTVGKANKVDREKLGRRDRQDSWDRAVTMARLVLRAVPENGTAALEAKVEMLERHIMQIESRLEQIRTGGKSAQWPPRCG
jgi:hypothetical protein